MQKIQAMLVRLSERQKLRIAFGRYRAATREKYVKMRDIGTVLKKLVDNTEKSRLIVLGRIMNKWKFLNVYAEEKKQLEEFKNSEQLHESLISDKVPSRISLY